MKQIVFTPETTEEGKRLAAENPQHFERFVSRWEQLQRRLLPPDQNARTRRRVGVRAGKAIPWQRSVRAGLAHGDPRIPAQVAEIPFAELFEVPLPKRRTPQERLADVTERLMGTALETFRQTGKLDLPRSMMDDIVREFHNAGIIVTVETLQAYTEDQIKQAMHLYGKQLLERVNRLYPHNDRTPEVGRRAG